MACVQGAHAAEAGHRPCRVQPERVLAVRGWRDSDSPQYLESDLFEATNTPGSQVHDQMVLLAHQRLAELQVGRRRFDWDGSEFGEPIARPEQIPDDSLAWRIWLYLGGRGTGKTRASGERVRHWVKTGRSRLGMIGATAADARDVMVEGESGMLAICQDQDRDHRGNLVGRPKYEPSKRRLTWENGAIATLYSAEEPQRLRGPQHEGIWGDEICAWKYMREVWDMAQFGLRLGTNPQMILSTTPKPIRLLREIIADPDTITTRGSTFDNKDNLSKHFIDQITKQYEGTTLGKQEIYAAILEEAEGALWRREWLDKARCKVAPELAKVCVSVDPAVTANEETSNETGIITCGTVRDLSQGFVLADDSGVYTPLGWAKAAIAAYHKHQANYILAEVNNGGDLVIQNIKNVDATIPIKTVHARKGKYLRAEPVAALYEQGRVFHLEDFEKLEDQLVCWEPLGDMPSPDRLDALVHGMTSLMIKGAPSNADFVAPPMGAKVEPLVSGFGG